jgi:YafQ family addiction module toxin component
MHKFEVKPELEKKLIKLSKKNKKTFEAIMKKINEIINSSNIEHYKNLRYDMKESRRVHIGHFVLVFDYDKANDFISFEDYDHHDNIYKK